MWRKIEEVNGHPQVGGGSASVLEHLDGRGLRRRVLNDCALMSTALTLWARAGKRRTLGAMTGELE
jgi:hypothetical protein